MQPAAFAYLRRRLGSVFLVTLLLGAITLVVVLSGGDPSDGSTAALERAAHAALGEQASVTTRAGGEPEIQPSASTIVGSVTWADDRRSVTVRTSDGQRTTEREIRFDASDAASERGRTVGFALASMVPDQAPAPAPVVVASLAPPVLRPPVEIGTSAPRPPHPPPWRFSVELLGQGAVGVGGTAGGGGGALAGRVSLGHGFAARVGVGFRVGEVPSAQATSRVFAPSVGVAWRTPVTESLSLGARADALVFNQFVSHFSPDDPSPDGLGRWLPGVDARLEGAFRLVDSTALFFGFGPEVAFGTTYVVVAGVETDKVPALRICGEVGVTVAF